MALIETPKLEEYINDQRPEIYDKGISLYTTRTAGGRFGSSNIRLIKIINDKFDPDPNSSTKKIYHNLGRVYELYARAYDTNLGRWVSMTNEYYSENITINNYVATISEHNDQYVEVSLSPATRIQLFFTEFSL